MPLHSTAHSSVYVQAEGHRKQKIFIPDTQTSFEMKIINEETEEILKCRGCYLPRKQNFYLYGYNIL